jgi:cell fate regulator YaaT (PSP1 superfamily)
MSGPAGSVVTVSFPPLGRQAEYALDGAQTIPAPGAPVVVESFRGDALGLLVDGPHPPRGGKGGKVRRYVRAAREADLAAQRAFEAREGDVLRRTVLWTRQQGRPWKVIRVVGDGVAGKFTICFAARERQDCQEDATLLGRLFDCRVVLRQLGTRDIARTLGGLGRCGRELCCSTFLPDYPNVNIRHAKEQGLALVGDKTSGVCGKTLCCLSYESTFYKDQLKWLPRVGKRAGTVDGHSGRVIGVDVFRLTFTLLDGDRRRHVLPATAWDGNASRAVPEPEICAPASAPALVELPTAARRPPSPEPPPPSPEARTGPPRGRGRRRRRGKKDPS